ncbi:sugar transporter, putative [Cordyceps militaris CM01]|uniref:Sugar transporter, putative n=1 Tax=Cordyceps militaris (strain CM01) TaxID=983644 RepID=G3JNJ7_CORMM|nr:sugar transporter, putative [Cordyceps militaris CM01]EGX89837.1 sugar transporter, putative [Cordyceps militaris CM01]
MSQSIAVGDPWSRSHRRTVSYCFVVALGPVLFGFDQAAISGTIVIPRFQRDFGSVDALTGQYIITASGQTLLFGLLLVGAIVASVLSGPVGTRYGRKAGLYCCAGTSLIGPLVQVVAPNMGVMIFGRVLSGAGIGFAANFCGTYWSEVALAKHRGLITQGLVNLTAFLGASIIQGVHGLSSKWAWRAPVVVMMIAPFIMLCLIPLLPETPRWYITRGRPDDALQALRDLRGSTWPEEELESEIREMSAMYELECSLEGSTTYRDCFRNTDLRRTRISLIFVVFQSFTGISFIAGYGTLFFALSGIKQPFLTTVITSCCGLGGSIAAFPLVRTVGRRLLLLMGSAVCGISMLLFAIVGTAKPNSLAAANLLVACVCIYLFAYSASWGPLPITVLTEIPSNGLRSKTLSMSTTVNWLSAMLIACGAPYLVNPQYANIGVKLGFIFGGVTVLGWLWVFFDVPETKDRTLEEIDEMFLNASDVLIRQSAATPKIIGPITTKSAASTVYSAPGPSTP